MTKVEPVSVFGALMDARWGEERGEAHTMLSGKTKYNNITALFLETKRGRKVCGKSLCAVVGIFRVVASVECPGRRARRQLWDVHDASDGCPAC